MKISLSTAGCRIIENGQTFLFGEDKDLKIDFGFEDGFSFSLILQFAEDDSEGHRIETETTENEIRWICYNFKDHGTGLVKPISIAKVDGKELLIMFWSYVEGMDTGRARSVKYTIFCKE